jgi:beta-glucosidase
LKDFRKIFLKVGASNTITFKIEKEKLSFYNQHLNWVAEPGGFQVMIGASSRDIRLMENFELIQ